MSSTEHRALLSLSTHMQQIKQGLDPMPSRSPLQPKLLYDSFNKIQEWQTINIFSRHWNNENILGCNCQECPSLTWKYTELIEDRKWKLALSEISHHSSQETKYKAGQWKTSIRWKGLLFHKNKQKKPHPGINKGKISILRYTFIGEKSKMHSGFYCTVHCFFLVSFTLLIFSLHGGWVEL